MLVSLRAYARHRGVALSAVQTAVKYQRITLTDGKVDVEQADRDWTANTHSRAVSRGRQKTKQSEDAAPSKRKRGRPRKLPDAADEPTKPIGLSREKKPADPPSASESVAPELDDDGGEPIPPGAVPPASPRSIAEERLWNEFYSRKKLALEVKQKQGELVPIQQVEREWFRLCRTVRDAILNIPNRYAALLASDTDTHSVHARLSLALREALESMAVEDAGDKAA